MINDALYINTKGYREFIRCPVCISKNYEDCGCNFTEYISYINDIESNVLELEYEISKLNYIIKTLREDIDY